MKTYLIMTSIALTLAIPVTLAGSPQTGDMAVSFNVGLAKAFDNDFDNVETVLTGTYEYYISPRFSWRGLLGATTFDADLPGGPSLDVTIVGASAVYNWEGGRIHPYLTAGVGFYEQSASSNLLAAFDESAFGMNVGAGINRFRGSHWGFKFEGTVHSTSGKGPDTFYLGTAGVILLF